MSLTITEANQINWVIQYWLEMDREVPVTEERVIDSMAHLADKAKKTLMAGVDGNQVRARWAELAAKSSPKPATTNTHEVTR